MCFPLPSQRFHVLIYNFVSNTVPDNQSCFLSSSLDTAPFSFSFFIVFPSLSCSCAPNFSPIHDIVLLTSYSTSSPSIWISLDFLAKSNVSFTCCSKLYITKINTQSGFFKVSAKTKSKVLVVYSFIYTTSLFLLLYFVNSFRLFAAENSFLEWFHVKIFCNIHDQQHK